MEYAWYMRACLKYTVLGLSNISFGLEKQARIVINSVFLYHAVKVGLDCHSKRKPSEFMAQSSPTFTAWYKNTDLDLSSILASETYLFRAE